MTLIQIPDEATFTSLREVLSFIDESEERISRTLQIIGFLTSYHKVEDTFMILLKNGYTLKRRHGIMAHFGKGDEELLVILTEEGVLYLITNLRKTDQIPEYILPLFKGEKNVYHLYVSPSMMMDIAASFIGQDKRGRITHFSGRYIPGSGKKSRIRPEIKRNAQYSGEDGYETLKEWASYYGIYPNIVTFGMFNDTSFRIDSQGIFSVYHGDCKNVLPFIDLIVRSNIMIKDRIEKTTSYEQVKLDDKNRTIGVEHPWKVDIATSLGGYDINAILRESSEEWKISYLSRIVDEGFLLADLIDECKMVKTELRIRNNTLNIYPSSKVDMGTNMKIYDLITSNIDVRAEVR